MAEKIQVRSQLRFEHQRNLQDRREPFERKSKNHGWENEQLKTQLEEETLKLKGNQEKLDGLKEDKAVLNDQALLIDSEFLKYLNKRLDESKPLLAIQVLEVFVALLRNRAIASHIDVKLYLKDHSKLMFKLKSIDARRLTISIVRGHITTL